MKFNIWTIGFFTGLILTFGSINKAVIVCSESVDTLAQSQDIARSAKLTHAQVEKLIAVDKTKIRIGLGNGEFENREFRVIVPTYIPPGFKVDKLEVEDNNSFKSYDLSYRNSNNVCFYIRNLMSSRVLPIAGLNGPDDAEIVSVNLPVIGNSYLKIYKDNKVSTNLSISLTQQETFKFFKFISGANISSCTENDKAITTVEAVKILESLKYLNP